MLINRIDRVQKNSAMLIGVALFTPQIQAADICEDYSQDIKRIESAGLKGDALFEALFEIEDASICPRWKIQSGIALGHLDEWGDAINEFKDARSPEHPLAYAHLANALWIGANQESVKMRRESLISEAFSNGEIAFKLYRKQTKTPPDWVISLMRELDEFTAEADAEYYAMVLSQSAADTRGSGVLPGLNVQINFDTRSHTLDAQALKKVGEIAQAIHKYLAQEPGASFEVVGHTDIVGSHEYNQGLSDRRAQSVVSKLTTMINGISVSGYGKGKTELKYPGNSDAINKFNRRVEIKMK